MVSAGFVPLLATIGSAALVYLVLLKDSFWVEPFIVGAVLYVALVCLVRVTGRRIEFYSEFIKVFPHRGKPIQIPYAQLNVRWKQSGSQLYTRGIITMKGSEQYRWVVENMKVASTEWRSLFSLIAEKTGQRLPEKMTDKITVGLD